jgi:hypothetical protein
MEPREEATTASVCLQIFSRLHRDVTPRPFVRSDQRSDSYVHYR